MENRPWQCRDEIAGRDQVGSQMDRERPHANVRHLQSACPKGLRHQHMVPNSGRRQYPALVDQIAQVNLPSIEPTAPWSSCDDELILKERLYCQVIGNGLLRETAPAARDDKI